jgi:hypothetical protein
MLYKVVVYNVKTTDFLEIQIICNNRQSKILDTNELLCNGIVNIYFQNYFQAFDA